MAAPIVSIRMNLSLVQQCGPVLECGRIALGWSFRGIQSSVATGSVVTKPPASPGWLTRNHPSVVPSPSLCSPGRPV